jgi:SWI/SNF-related matrix-associated actin-dependent regulator of chromatin subfamily A member 5
MHVIILTGANEECAEIIANRLIPQVCIMSMSAFKKFSFEYIVIDVAHGIKNVDSIPFPDRVVVPLTQEAVDHRYPLQNSLKELFTLLNTRRFLWIMRI